MARFNSVFATLAAGILLNSGSVFASEDNYPAYDFKPTVIYSNADLIKTVGALASASSSSGAVNTASAPNTHTAEFDPKYPAAYFAPSVIIPAH